MNASFLRGMIVGIVLGALAMMLGVLARALQG